MTDWRLVLERDSNPVVYPASMSEIIEELRALGKEVQGVEEHREALLAQRSALVAKAREQGITWRALALALDMTEHGLIKTTAAHAKKSQ